MLLSACASSSAPWSPNLLPASNKLENLSAIVSSVKYSAVESMTKAHQQHSQNTPPNKTSMHELQHLINWDWQINLSQNSPDTSSDTMLFASLRGLASALMPTELIPFPARQ
jgi:hypothetical protein